MPNPARHHEAFFRVEFNGLVFQIDQQFAIDDIEKLIKFRVRMSMIFAFDDPEPDDGIVHLAQSLVPPFVAAGVDQPLDIDLFLRPMQDVQECLVRIFCRFVRHYSSLK
jgi:hypothetical protein